MELRDLYLRKGQLAEEAQAIIDKAHTEQRDLKPEEETKFDAIHADIEKLNATIQRLERQQSVDAELSQHEGRRTVSGQPRTAPNSGERREAAVAQRSQDNLRALRAWFLAGSPVQPDDEDRAAAQRVGVPLNSRSLTISMPAQSLSTQYSPRHGFPLSLSGDQIRDWEQRALGVGTAGAGGNTVPDEAMRALEVAMLEFGGMRQAATVIRTASGADMPIPTTNDTGNVGILLAENTVVPEDDAAFGQLVLQAFKYSSSMVRVSTELMQDNAVNLATFLGRALGERIGRITNTHFTVGTGTNQPNGIVTAATVGFTGATSATAVITYDDLVETQHSVDPAYRVRARWMFSDQMLRLIKLLKDTQDRPLWLPGLAFGQPDSILGHPFIINQDVPDPAPDARSIVFGALEKYWIRDVRDVTLLRLDERFADFHQVAFLAFSRHDGDLLDAGTNPVKVFVHGPAI